MPNYSKQHFLECEARAWISHGYRLPEQREHLRRKITIKRGEAAANKLINQMIIELRKMNKPGQSSNYDMFGGW